MSTQLTRVLVVSAVVVAAAQFVRPGRVNPPIETGRTIAASSGASRAAVEVLDRSCGDCHSNHTVWRWYTQAAPVSWLMAYEVAQGRTAVNFSEWTSYRPERQRALLVASCRDAQAGKMPGPYAWLQPETRLSAADIDSICAAARRADIAVTMIDVPRH